MNARVVSLTGPTEGLSLRSRAPSTVRRSVSDRSTLDVLITGASGFIGRHLAARYLGEDLRVGLLVRRPSAVEDLRDLGATVVGTSLFDTQALMESVRGCRTVIHLAAMTSALSRNDLFAVNGQGTRNLAQACRAQSRPPHLIYVSSVAAAGPCAAGSVRTEIDAPAPVSNYGRSKLAGELAVAEIADEVPTTIVRPGIVFGPGNREMLPMFQAIKYLRFHPVVGWRGPQLSMSYIDDTVESITQAAEYGTRLPREQMPAEKRLTSGRGVYFACCPEYPDYAELGKIIRVHLKRPWAPVVPLVGPAPWIAAGINQIIAYCRRRPDAFNIDKVREATASSWACSCERIEAEFGLHPSRSLADAIQETVAWYKHQRWL